MQWLPDGFSAQQQRAERQRSVGAKAMRDAQQLPPPADKAKEREWKRLSAMACAARHELGEFARVPPLPQAGTIVEKQKVLIMGWMCWPIAKLIANKKSASFLSALARAGGPRVRILTQIASFDANLGGSLSDAELVKATETAASLIGETTAMLENMATVLTLFLGALFVIVIASIKPWEPTPEAIEFIGASAASTFAAIGYFCCCFGGCSCFMGITLSFAARFNIAQLSSKSDQLSLLAKHNLIGYGTMLLFVSLWSFMVTMVSGALIASPRYWWMMLLATAFSFFINHIISSACYDTFRGMHAEARRVVLGVNVDDEEEDEDKGGAELL